MIKLNLAVPALAALALGLGGCSEGEKAPTVSFKNDVQPVLAANCLECHTANAAGTKASGLNMESYENLMKGTMHGPIIKAGDSLSSTMVMLIEGRADPSIRMPHGKEPMSDDQIAILKTWVDEGALNN